MRSITMWITDSGASTEEIERGVAAAEALLAERGLTPEAAFAASLAAAEGEPHDAAHAQAWCDAEIRAIDECCKGWLRLPEGASLMLG